VKSSLYIKEREEFTLECKEKPSHKNKEGKQRKTSNNPTIFTFSFTYNHTKRKKKRKKNIR